MPEKRAPYWRIVNLRDFLKQACFDVNFCNPLVIGSENVDTALFSLFDAYTASTTVWSFF